MVIKLNIIIRTHLVRYGSLPESQKPSGHGGWFGGPAGRNLMPILRELVHHPHAGQSHGRQQSQSDEVYVRLDGGSHHQH